LIADGAGNLYGTSLGGKHGDGVVFELSPPAVGNTLWTKKALFAFNGADGDSPLAGVIADHAGNFYGTTFSGGANKDGVVFELSPPTAGQTAWTETVLVSFNGTNGRLSNARLIEDGAGNLYGTVQSGGSNGDGVVFELSPPAVGQTAWADTVLFSFNGTNGAYPIAGLTADGAGNLYGTTTSGGRDNHGVVFELSPPAAGQTAWTETVLLSFNGTNGAYPAAGLIADGAGNLYGTAETGGASNDGAVFELSPPAAGQTRWTEKVLASFNGTDGMYPAEALIADSAGNLYGSTGSGGTYDDGVIFELSGTGFTPRR
jgi:uncharacterized repeat protein (TIGR03803 family)